MSKEALSWKGGGGGGERRACSFLVRIWREPREIAGEGTAVRGYVRDLQSGEEQYVTDPREIAGLLERVLESAEAEESKEKERRRPAGGETA